MSMEERIVALEQGLAAVQRVQQELLLQFADTSSARLLGILNKAILTQEHNYRELSEDLTMLVGPIAKQGQDIKALKEEVKSLKQDIVDIEVHLARQDEQLAHHGEQLAQQNEQLVQQDQSLGRIETVLTQHTELFAQHATLL